MNLDNPLPKLQPLLDQVSNTEATHWQNWPKDLNTLAGDHGLAGLYCPASVGGQDLSLTEVTQVFDLLGASNAAYGFAWSVHNAATYMICTHGSDRISTEWARTLCHGRKMAGFSLTEDNAGSNPAAISTRAHEQPDGSFRLNGRKAWVTLAGQADVLTVVAKLSDVPGHRDMAMFTVPTDSAGLTFGTNYDLPGMSFLPVADLMLDDVLVPADAVLLPRGKGLTGALGAIDMARVCVAALSCGLIQTALDKALAHTSQRALYGGNALGLDGVQWMLGDIDTDLDLARLLTQSAARKLGTEYGSISAAKAKLFAPEAALRAATTAAQLMGGSGLRADAGMDRLIQMARVFKIVDGTSEVQRKIIGRALQRRVSGPI